MIRYNIDENFKAIIFNYFNPETPPEMINFITSEEGLSIGVTFAEGTINSSPEKLYE
jgi:hypothetical protein